MSKKTRGYSLSDEVYEAVRKRALKDSAKAGKRVSESAVVESILAKALLK